VQNRGNGGASFGSNSGTTLDSDIRHPERSDKRFIKPCASELSWGKVRNQGRARNPAGAYAGGRQLDIEVAKRTSWRKGQGSQISSKDNYGSEIVYDEKHLKWIWPL